MVEIMIVIAIVAVVAVLAGRSFYRTMTGRNDGCGGCSGTCQECVCGDRMFTNTDKRRQEE